MCCQYMSPVHVESLALSQNATKLCDLRLTGDCTLVLNLICCIDDVASVQAFLHVLCAAF